MVIIKIFRRMLKMSDPAWYIFKRTLQLSCFLLLCAFVLLCHGGADMVQRYEISMTAGGINETVQALLLAGGLFSAIIEELHISSK